MATENTLNVTNKANRVFRWAETFTETMEHFRVPVGESYAPSYTFNGYERCGLYLSETDDAGGSNPEVRLTIAETEVFRANDDYFRVMLPIYEADGTASAPSYTFKGDADTGWFLNDTAELSGAIAGTETFRLDANGITTADGAAGTPAYSFLSDTDAGMFLRATGAIGWSLAGTETMRLDSTGLGINVNPASSVFGALHAHGGTDANMVVRTQSTELTVDALNDAGSAYVPFRSSASEYNIFDGNNSKEIVSFYGTEISINDGANDIDVRVEGTGNANLLFADAGNDRVGIKNPSPLAVLDVIGDTRIGDSTTNYATFASDGELNLVGTARVTKRRWIPANSIQAAGAKPASLSLNGNGFVVWSFADNQDQQIQYNIDVPPDMDLSADAYFCMGWSSPATSQVAVMDLTYLVTALNDSTDQAGTATTGIQLTSSATADGLVVSSPVTISGGTLSDEVCIHIILERDGSNANDTLGNVLELHGVALQYVSNKLGTAT